MTQNILIVDDDTGIVSALTMLIKSEGYWACTARSPDQALVAIREQDFSLILMDLNYSLDTTSGDEGLELVAAIRKLDEQVPIVVMTGWGTIEVAVEAMKFGANDFIQKPWENDRLLAIIKNQIQLANSQKRSLKLSVHNRLLREEASPDSNIIAEAPATKRILDTLNQVVKSDIGVLLTGENGTGKSMFASYLHNQSGRCEETFVAVNMGAVTETLFESEMFGHVKGAFTDAKSSRIGRFELADEGTLFLDEIANTPYSQQGKLLRVLETSQFEKVGSSRTQTVDVRLIAATNADLEKAVEEGLFRKDLLYRINTIVIEIPPLRNRVEDIIPLANAFLRRASEKYGKPQLPVDPRAQSALMSYAWPGNVRELSHVMERAQILCKTSSIQIKDFGLGGGQVFLKSMDKAGVRNNTQSLSEIERDAIIERLDHFDGDAVRAAQSLGLSRSAFYRKLQKAKT